MLKQNLNSAFKALRKKGYFARQSWTCCSTCGWYEVPDDKGDKAVFYHKQDATGLRDGRGVYLAWSGDAAEIVKTLTEAGVKAEHDGSPSRRIFCHPE